MACLKLEIKLSQSQLKLKWSLVELRKVKVRGKHVGMAVEGLCGAGTRPLGMDEGCEELSEGAINTPTNTSTPITLRKSLLTDRSRGILRPAALTNVGGRHSPLAVKMMRGCETGTKGHQTVDDEEPLPSSSTAQGHPPGC